MKFCGYCLRPVAGRRWYCDDDHAARARRQRQSAAQLRSRGLRIARVRAQERARWRTAWRQLAMGTAPEAALAAIFEPSDRARRRARLKLTAR